MSEVQRTHNWWEISNLITFSKISSFVPTSITQPFLKQDLENFRLLWYYQTTPIECYRID